MRRFLKAMMLGALAVSSPLAAATINVPSGQPTIQGAIDAAVNGDEVVVAAGTYFEKIDFKGKAITVRSASGPAVTILDGQQGGPVVHFQTAEGQGAVLRGFTVRNGKLTSSGLIREGAGIRIKNASPQIINNVVTGNQSCSGGAGIYISGGSPLISGNTISNNSQTTCTGGSGGGIYITLSSPRIINNTIQNNSFSSGGGIGMNANNSGIVTISNNTIAGNTGSTGGGGLDIINGVNLTLAQNRIVGNTGGRGGGINWSAASGVIGRVSNNTIAENHSTNGSGINYSSVSSSQVQWANNIIQAKTGQTAVVCSTTTTILSFRNNDVYSPSGTHYSSACANPTGTNGNVSVNPLLAAGTYFLQAGSPAIDAGDNAAAGLPVTDFAGGVRLVDGNADGTARIDLGVDEI